MEHQNEKTRKTREVREVHELDARELEQVEGGIDTVPLPEMPRLRMRDARFIIFVG